jgi:hypothetical protein
VCDAQFVVTASAWNDCTTLLRCWRFWCGLPEAIVFAGRTLGPLSSAYDAAVMPLLRAAADDPAQQARMDSALRAMSLKMGVAMASFARLAGCEPRLEVLAIAGAATRLYDDLIDWTTDTTLDDRLSDLFNMRSFAGRTAAERLFAELFRAIVGRLRPGQADAMTAALKTLHEYQCLSRQQHEPDVSLEAQEKISRGKGAMAHLTLVTLTKPHLDAGERDLVLALGEAFQSLDDYADVAVDTSNGVATLATAGMLTLADVVAQMGVLRSALLRQYGAAATRRFYGLVYLMLLTSIAGRRLPALGAVARRISGKTAVYAVLARGAEVET